MSVADAITKLSSPLRELVSGVEDAHHGKTEKDKAEVTQWIQRVAVSQAVTQEGFKVSRTFVSIAFGIDRRAIGLGP